MDLMAWRDYGRIRDAKPFLHCLKLLQAHFFLPLCRIPLVLVSPSLYSSSYLKFEARFLNIHDISRGCFHAHPKLHLWIQKTAFGISRLLVYPALVFLSISAAEVNLPWLDSGSSFLRRSSLVYSSRLETLPT